MGLIGGKRLIELGAESQYVVIWRALIELMSISIVAWVVQRYWLKRSEGISEVYLIAGLFCIGKIFHNLILDKIIGAGGQKTMCCPLGNLGWAPPPQASPQPLVLEDSSVKQAREQQAVAERVVNAGMVVADTESIVNSQSYGKPRSERRPMSVIGQESADGYSSFGSPGGREVVGF
jgi:hypothetical protein